MEEQNRENINQILPEEISIPEIDGRQDQPAGQDAPPFYGQQVPPSYGQPVLRPYQPRGRKTGKIIGIVACVIAVVVMTGIVTAAYYTSRPVYKIAKGLHKLGAEFSEIHNPLTDKLGLEEIMTMMEEDGSHIGTRLNFTTETLLGSTTLGIDTQLYKDMQAKELDSSTTVSIMNYEIAHLNLYGNEDVICFSVPELFLENMYFDTENVVSQYNASVLADEDMFGRLEMEDFSVDLFPENQDRISIGNYRSLTGFMEQYESDLVSCRQNMTVDKVENGLYRVEFTGQDMDRLFADMLHYYNDLYDTDDIDLEAGMEDYEQLIASDVSVLFEIDRKNRIESITSEKPVEMLDGEASVDWELFFLGEERSIDKMQGKVTVTNVMGEEVELIAQLVQMLEDDDYQVNLDMKYVEEEDSRKIKFAMDCDASEDIFDLSFSLKKDSGTLELAAAGALDDIVQGESFALDLDAFTIGMDGEELGRITGDITVAPLQESITPGVEAGTAIFEMSAAEIGDIMYKLIVEYGNLADLLDY